MEPSGKNKLLPIVIALGALLFIGFIMVWSVRKKPSSVTTYPAGVVPSPGPSLTPTLIPRPVLGSMTMKTKDGNTRYKTENPIHIIVQASSEGKHIVGYDAILNYDNTVFLFQGGTSLSPDFQLHAYDRQTYISFSGIRSLQSKTVDSWSLFPLIEVVVIPKMAGNYTFELSPSGREASKLVDDKAQVVYPKTEKLQLEIYP